MSEKLDLLYQEFQQALCGSASRAETLDLKAGYLGSKGKLSSILKSLKDMSPEERKQVGSKSNEYKNKIEADISAKLQALDSEEISKKLEKQWVDVTLKDSNLDLGLNAAGYHPVTLVQREIEDIFSSMGFDILDGPHIEDDWHNFGALNIPSDHPARDMQDTLWFPDGVHLLRTHTSPVQVRGMESKKPPFKFIVPGKVFRAERTDASHETVFHQVEGMMVDKNITVSNLIYFMKTMLSEIFKQDVKIQLRPGFFPFVEPGFELDMYTEQLGWLELIGCGMTHPNVLRAGGIDPDKYSGFAFGMGLDRLVMMRYAINDVRLIHSADLRFISQFRSF
ncbi:MAG: phenylalanine--tRNA ligase subunit alpha [Deltaproteobacteria bacterium]|nr:phenylalanine--tRNA ligase subunit alpha [Deltaproteobacteria bacterium]